MNMHLIVHRVEAELLSIMDEQSAGFVFRDRPEWISRILGPVSQIV